MMIEDGWAQEQKPKNNNSSVWRGYMPMNCPNCGRRRLCLFGDDIEGKKELGYMYIFCEKCDFKTEDWELTTPENQPENKDDDDHCQHPNSPLI